VSKFLGKILRNSWNNLPSKVGFLKYLCLLNGAKFKFFMAILAGVLYGISSGFGIPVILKFSADHVFSNKDFPLSVMILVSIAPVFAMTLRAFFSIVSAYYLGFCGQKILQELRVKIFDKIQRLPLEYFKKTEPGILITRSLSDTAILQEIIVSVSQEAIKQPVAVIGALGALVYMCHKQSDVAMLLIFFFAAAAVVFPIKIVGEKMLNKAVSLRRATEKITTKLAHNLSAVQEIRAFAMEEREILRYRSVCDGVMVAVMKTLKYSIITSPIIEVIASIGIGMAMFYAYVKHIEPSVFIALSGALYLSYEPIKKIADLNNRLKSGSASLSQIEELLNLPEKICDPKNPVKIGKLSGDIAFENVNFSYDENSAALSGISAFMGHGRTYALVGVSGAGKTTMANLILRFYDVTGGAIKIDGVDIRSMRLRDLRGNISYVPQFSTLMSGTIFENIGWSAPDATPDRIIEAARRAYAHEFISKLENGYDTQVGEGGALLSGGQKQRIAIARAFLRDSPILILDEATSALDANSEREVHAGIADLTKNRTSILISHRFTMMSIVDTVFVIDRGSIVEIGRPDELASKENSLYSSLYQKQCVQK
jgi:subfamily B ATP-binding cassette protein MsbA